MRKLTTDNLQRKTDKGFTLIEILVVIGIIAILAAIVLIAINPARQFAQANNTQRESNTNAILNAIGQYMVDHSGNLPTIPDGEVTETLCGELVPDYLPAMPIDPSNDNGTEIACDDIVAGAVDYNVTEIATTSRIMVCAPETAIPPADEEICVTR